MKTNIKSTIATTNTVPLPNWVTVTPELARRWLTEHNNINRHVRKQWVEYLADQITAGRFEPTSDAIAFRESDGALVNGQHRLLAIVRANKSVTVLVVHGMSDEAFTVTDRGVGRSAADALKIQNALLADAGLAYRMIHDILGTKRLAEIVQRDTVAWWEPAYTALTTRITFSRGFSSSPMRIGFGARWAIADTPAKREVVLAQWRALMASDVQTMSAATASLWKRVSRGATPGHGAVSSRMETAALVWQYTDPTRAAVEPRYREKTRMELVRVLELMEEAWTNGPAPDGHPYKWNKKPTK